ncbi:hypothetical protein QBC32DRAFT_129031 [Pseudoneurospora amorphoporcata]|uniref:Uncharacterized protein n=1 Tax=Pseudoneurospora amorphoporcata TaxID=241081 RepID=A0AAN6SH58_9PEZI|nr:hypothetical protein QBC32DRAFT_129031 [Pseudoneurospora amorphoporcata]
MALVYQLFVVEIMYHIFSFSLILPMHIQGEEGKTKTGYITGRSCRKTTFVIGACLSVLLCFNCHNESLWVWHKEIHMVLKIPVV